MKIFVTGGTGFIGSHFINRAHEAGHELLALRRSERSKPRLPLRREPAWLDKPMTEVAPEDLAGCGAMVHLAAHSANVPYDTLEACLRWNLVEPLGLLARAHEAGIRRFVVAGSCFEYGSAGERYENIPPDAPLEPTLAYPASKAAASIAFRQFAIQHGVGLVMLRIFQVFGEGEAEGRLWPSLRKAALAGEDFPMTQGEQVRDFIPVEQVADRFLAAVERPDFPPTPRVENVGTGIPQTLRQFAERWWRHWGATGKLLFGALPYRENEVMRYVPLIRPGEVSRGDTANTVPLTSVWT